MNKFEPGQHVRLRSGGIRMVVTHPSHTSQLQDTTLVPCEYQAKHRTVQGFFAAANLVHIGTRLEPHAEHQDRLEP
ncbi:hypothetical protein NLK61_25630 [Pseudomonas fuscovaginae UPB0736]|uniref:Uncharacterized protein n=1 Tax=Pseudomonas asplenii TaxID=53407 RepID=A0A1H6NXF6_9PSED|nr:MULTISPECIES: hypothetical protein [Pseudomonas]UUQ64547.1 hypothetical protein NLK61_25630 [Pseudomonas fuscovaginae UPB0736]UZE26968.1 hypothetical protein LOY63_16385 [Pseudomonas asplenii]SEI21631.1 hypothetical protein SAMN05216581_4565 [Pseudomonas fuscovaginae]